MNDKQRCSALNTAYIALGSNLDDPIAQLNRAVTEIDQLNKTSIVACSKLYRSDPVGPADQPDYCNAVVKVATQLSPIALLDSLQGIEQLHGRVRKRLWGERTLDLDILLFNNEVIESERLIVPHYQMHLRNFVLLPLLDVAESLSLPCGASVRELADNIGTKGIRVISVDYPWQDIVQR